MEINTTYPNTKSTNLAEAFKLIDELKQTGHFFSAIFIKKTNGEVRHMTCRFGVKKYVNGKGLKFNPTSKGLMVVWDSVKKDYRMLNVNNLLMIHYKGTAHLFN